MTLTLHHIGYAVESITHAKNLFAHVEGLVFSQVVDVPEQKVKVCLAEYKQNLRIELVEAYEDNTYILKLARKGSGLYHIAFTTNNLQGQIQRLKKMGYIALPTFRSGMLHNKECVFLIPKQGVFIELIAE